MTDAARALLAKRGYDPANGARPMDRVIREKIRRPLADELLFGKLAGGGDLIVDVNEDEFVFELPSADAD